MLICAKQLPNNWLCHSGASESWRSCPNPMRQANLILCIQFFSQRSFSNPSVTSPTSQLILQSFRRFTYVTVHSPTLPLLHVCHSSFSNIIFTYVTWRAAHTFSWVVMNLTHCRILRPAHTYASRCGTSRCVALRSHRKFVRACGAARRVALRCGKSQLFQNGSCCFLSTFM